MLDPISDMLTRIRNAKMAKRKEVVIPASKLKLAITQVLLDNKFIDSVKIVQEGHKKEIKINLNYKKTPDNKIVSAISQIQRVSKPGQRIYIAKDEIKKVKNGYGISVVSTSKGVMTGQRARKLGIGGEYICRVW